MSNERIEASLKRPATHPIKFPVPPSIRIPVGVNTGFTDAFPDADELLKLSMPGYSTSGNIAVVQMTVDCGGLCAHAEYVVLRKVGEQWQVVHRKVIWTS